jgi:AmmeMemoRadiSam system protein A
MLSDNERVKLLKIARETIFSQVSRGRKPSLEAPEEPGLSERCGAFVSLHSRGALRGCIGTFMASVPLHETVMDMAVAAATEDPRFEPVRPHELREIDIEISVLSPLRRVADPAEVEVGKHGVYITRGRHRGVLLPQVATEYGWDRETFLEHTCHKAGLPPEAWKEPGTIIEVFTAEVFGEKR